MIVFAGIVPHPPILIPEIGKGEEEKAEKTLTALDLLAERLAESKPDTVIFISPHMVHYPHLFNVCGMSDLYGSFRNFEAPNFEWHGFSHLELAEEIVDKSEDEGLPAVLYDNGEGEYEIDHGVMVPLYFLMESEMPFKVLPIGYSYASRSEHYTFGEVISGICEKRGDERIAIIASGDLSHHLQHGSSAQIKAGEAFDKEIISLIKKGDSYSIVNMPEKLVDESGECAYRSILILLGALEGKDLAPEMLSYEAPFGVGYMVADMLISRG